jgi:hypothetical protein
VFHEFLAATNSKVVLRVGPPRKQGRKEGRKKERRRRKQDSLSSKADNNNFKKQRKSRQIKRVFFQVSKYSPQETRPQLPSFLSSHSTTIFFFPWVNLKKNSQISVLDCSMYPKKCEQYLIYYSQIWLNYFMDG